MPLQAVDDYLTLLQLLHKRGMCALNAHLGWDMGRQQDAARPRLVAISMPGICSGRHVASQPGEGHAWCQLSATTVVTLLPDQAGGRAVPINVTATAITSDSGSSCCCSACSSQHTCCMGCETRVLWCHQAKWNQSPLPSHCTLCCKPLQPHTQLLHTYPFASRHSTSPHPTPPTHPYIYPYFSFIPPPLNPAPPHSLTGSPHVVTEASPTNDIMAVGEELYYVATGHTMRVEMFERTADLGRAVYRKELPQRLLKVGTWCASDEEAGRKPALEVGAGSSGRATNCMVVLYSGHWPLGSSQCAAGELV